MFCFVATHQASREKERGMPSRSWSFAFGSFFSAWLVGAWQDRQDTDRPGVRATSQFSVLEKPCANRWFATQSNPVGSMLRPLATGLFFCCRTRALFSELLWKSLRLITTPLNTHFFFFYKKKKQQLHGNSQITCDPSVRRLRARSLGKKQPTPFVLFVFKLVALRQKASSICVFCFCHFSHSWHFFARVGQ